MRVGGPFEVGMRSPKGVGHWTRGTFAEVIAPERLTIDYRSVRRRSAVQRRHAGELR
jgi:hypothetical protein